MTIDRSPLIQLGLRELSASVGGNWSVERKRKLLNKFGVKNDVGTARATLWEVDQINETYNGDNVNDIDSIASSNAADVGQVIVIEGHVEVDFKLTFVVQTATLNGQNRVVLDTPLHTTDRAYVQDGSLPVAGDVHIFADVALTGGVPSDLTYAHNVIKGTLGNTQSFKAVVTMSNADAFLITSCSFTLGAKTNGLADCRLERKTLGAGLYRPVTGIVTVSGSGSSTVQTIYDPPLVLGPNQVLRASAAGSTTNLLVGASINGILCNRTTDL